MQFDEQRVVCGTSDVDILLHDLRTGQEKRLARHQRGVKALKFAGNTLVSGSMDGTCKLWSI